MPITPRTSLEIQDEIMAMFVAQTRGLNDLRPGSVVHSLIGSIALSLAGVERSIRDVYDAFHFKGSIGEVVRRAQAIDGFNASLGPSTAAGPAMQVTRQTVFEPTEIPAGTRFETQDGRAYISVETATFLANSLVYPAQGQSPIRVAATRPGAAGNANPHDINILGSQIDGVISVTNVTSVTGGSDGESLSGLLTRLNLFQSAVTGGPTVSRLRYLALSFTDSDGMRAKHVSIYEHPSTPGYVEVIVDDGQGFAGSTRAASTISETVPSTAPVTGQRLFYFDYPAVDDAIALTVNDDLVTSIQWSLIQERGVAIIDPNANILPANAIWSTSGHTVYTGFIKNLQLYLDGNPAIAGSGFVDAGIRVRVVPPTVRNVTFSARIISRTGYDLTETAIQVRQAIISYLESIAPGATVIISQLITFLHETIPGLLNIRFVNPNDETLPQGDIQPADERERLSTLYTLITINGA